MAAELPSTIELTAAQIGQGANLLARVFCKSPDMSYFLGDENRMFSQAALRFFRAIIRTGMLYGAVHTTETMDGLAVWVGPGNTDFSFGLLVRTGLLSSLLLIGLKPLARFVRSAGYLEKMKSRAISGPHWVLVQLGVEPALQGKGIGGLLIQPVLDKADDGNIPCYVESADERNLSFYSKHGFEIKEQGQVPSGGPRVWVMVREPGST